MFFEDILIVDNGFDVPEERSVFPTMGKSLGDKFALHITRLLSIEEGYYERDLNYNPETKYREYNLIIKTPLRVNLKNGKILLFEEGEKLNVWKHRQDTFEFVSEKMNNNGFKLHFIAKHPKEGKIIYIARLV
jgi:hypothetical protein